MISLVFMVCAVGIECKTLATEQMFSSVQQCEGMAQLIMLEAQQAVDRGDIAPHTASFICLEWGEPV
jgi:hypothetical protein